MNNWKTDLNVTASNQPFGIHQSVLTVGSCFAEVVGNYLTDNKFQTLANPFGTVYNPLSIHALLAMSIHHTKPDPEGYIERDGLFYHYQFHSSFCEQDKGVLQTRISSRIAEVSYFIRGCKTIILTYGTSFIYTLKATGEVVANCHKMPGELFEKKILSAQEIIDSFKTVYDALKKINPTIQLITTISPVRHLKDTLQLNAVSKSTLRLACHQLNGEGVDYFPAFEIMMDDLRDYRFYQKDRIHPTTEAEEYILEKFNLCYFSPSTAALLSELERIRHALNHRPFHPTTTAHQTFLKKTLSQLNNISNRVDVKTEINWVQSQLLDR
jgi:hypothetical protein